MIVKDPKPFLVNRMVIEKKKCLLTITRFEWHHFFITSISKTIITPFKKLFNLIMKKVFSLIRINIIPVVGLILASALFSSCMKDNEQAPQPPVAGLMAFNLVPDKAAIGIQISGKNFTNVPLYYTNYSGSYRGIYTGSRTLQSFNAQGGETLATTTYAFEDSMYYSMFVVGVEGNYKNVIVQDKLDTLPFVAGKSYIRYINAIPDSLSTPLISVTTATDNVFDSQAGYATVSSFKEVTSGEVMVSVSNELDIDADRTITLEEGGIYTLLLTGLPGSTDDDLKVQIKFIANGTIEPTP